MVDAQGSSFSRFQLEPAFEVYSSTTAVPKAIFMTL